MVLRSEVSVSGSAAKIDLHHPLVTLGSCFANHLGQRLRENKFNTLVNPFGTCYNPLAIHKLLRYSITQAEPDAKLFLEVDGHARHFDFHSSFTAERQPDLLNLLNTAIGIAHAHLLQTDVVLITYGTSWAYQHKSSGRVVANCHKIPGAQFEKRLITQQEVVHDFATVYSQLKAVRRNVRVILTVSPVRHLRDTIELNSVSKAVLRTSCHELAGSFADVEYFPAFEILIDDLRDYRFYEADLIHPTPLAIEYIWNIFQQRYFSSATQQLLQTWQKLRSAIAHRAFQPASAAHQKFLAATLQQLQQLSAHLPLQAEIDQLQSQQHA
jgi:hypothetical protein